MDSINDKDCELSDPSPADEPSESTKAQSGTTPRRLKLENVRADQGLMMRVRLDRAAIDEHWNEWIKTWFPDGKDDPDLALIRVDVDTAEYWDGPSSKMVVAFDYLKARMTGKTPDMGENRKIDVR